MALSDAARCERDDVIFGLQGLIFAHVGRWDEAVARVEQGKNSADPTLNLVFAAAARTCENCHLSAATCGLLPDQIASDSEVKVKVSGTVMSLDAPAGALSGISTDAVDS